MPILLIRHGNTTYDKKIDAMLDPPLTREGVERVKRTAAFLKDRGIIFDRVVSSPLQRALLAAQIIAPNKVTTHQHALPWHLGDLMGKTNEEAGAEVDRLEEYPHLRAPHGESYARFYGRWTDFLATVMHYSAEHPDETIGLVTHSRNINALQTFIGGAGLGDIKETTPEASVTLLRQDESGDWSYKIIWQGN